MSYNTYHKSQQKMETPRQVEYRAFVLATRQLMEAARGSDTKKICEAAQFNRELWTVLQADLADSRNKLPDQLKANLLSLSIWVQRQTSAVMRGEASVDSLVQVNTDIMEGLKGGPETAQP